jgi:hypothetical protein
MTVRAEGVSPVDLESIERAARDYIESWLTGDADRMADCLHTELVKRALDFDAVTGGISIDTMTHADMVAATAVGHGREMPRDYEVTVVDAFRNVATATVDSARFVDYLQIGRFADRWRIVNVLWEPLKRH